MTKETVGKIARDLMMKDQESRSPIELEREMQSEYMEELLKCVDTHYELLAGNFFIQVITKNEKLLHNVFRNYFAARRSCPTPDYDQTVFMYNREKGAIEYIWTIPSKDTCIHLLMHANEVVESERPLLKFVMQFENGQLARRCMELNNEKIGDVQGTVSVIN